MDSLNSIGSKTSWESSSAIEAMDVALPGIRAVFAHFKPYNVFNMNKKMCEDQVIIIYPDVLQYWKRFWPIERKRIPEKVIEGFHEIENQN